MWMACALMMMSMVAQVQGTGQGPFQVRDAQLRGISGITHVRDSIYYVVDDLGRKAGRPHFHEMRIEIDSRTGHVLEAVRLRSVPIAEGDNFEGIAYLPRTDEFALCSETDHSVAIYDAQGNRRRRLALPDVFTHVVAGRSLESMAYDLARDALWTAVEAPLAVDADTRWVRIQRFVAEKPEGQFAVALEPARDDAGASFNGLSELLVLPDGSLLALERDFDSRAMNIVVRVFRLDWSAATDVSGLDRLGGAAFRPMRKLPLLGSAHFPQGSMTTLANYESMVLGPALADGSTSLLLGPADDADNGFFIPESLHSLRIWLPPSAQDDAPRSPDPHP